MKKAPMAILAALTTVAPTWAQVPVQDAQALIDRVNEAFNPDVLRAFEQAQAARDMQFFIAGMIVFLVGNAVASWRAARAPAGLVRARWLRALASQWVSAACAFGLVKLGMGIDSGVIACILGVVLVLFMANRDVQRLRANAANSPAEA